MEKKREITFEKVEIIKKWYSKHNDDYPLTNSAAAELLDELGII